MGESSAKGESILGNFVEKEDCLVEDKRLPNREDFTHLHIFDLDMLKYVYGKAFGHNKFGSDSILEIALKVEIIKGETKNEHDR